MFVLQFQSARRNAISLRMMSEFNKISSLPTETRATGVIFRLFDRGKAAPLAKDERIKLLRWEYSNMQPIYRLLKESRRDQIFF